MRKIVGYDIAKNDYVGFKSIAEASKYVNKKHFYSDKAVYISIYKCCNGIIHSAYGYIWRYDDAV